MYIGYCIIYIYICVQYIKLYAIGDAKRYTELEISRCCLGGFSVRRICIVFEHENCDLEKLFLKNMRDMRHIDIVFAYSVSCRAF